MRARTVPALLLAAAAVLVAGVIAPSPAAGAGVATARAECFGGGFDRGSGDAAAAKELMAGRLRLGAHPATTLPRNLTWREDPFGDPNWVFQLHTLRWADVLRREGVRTHNKAMLARHRAILADWVRDNPRSRPPSPFSWSDMATGLRAIAYSCAIGSYGYQPDLVAALRSHGAVLANPRFGASRGNHALHVRLGLLVAGCVVPDPAWTRAARARIDTLLAGSVDVQGVTDEGSTAYEASNYVWYQEAERRVRACALGPGALFRRVDLMPAFLAQATAPDGTYEQIGDGDRNAAVPIAGSPAALYAATLGRRGVAPGAVYSTYRRGYVFGRSGWGRARKPSDELFYALRFGPPMAVQVHAHEDAGALTLYAYGRQLLFDAGRYKYDDSALSAYLRSRAAHDTVDVPGARYDHGAATALVTSRHTAAYDLTTVRVTALRGTTWTRTVLYSRTGQYLVVDDALVNSGDATMVQRWNLPEDGARTLRGAGLSVTGPGADLSMTWLGAAPDLSLVTARRSYRYATSFPAPVVEARTTGRTGRFTTVIAPRPDASGLRLVPRVTSSSVSPGAVDLTVSVGARGERVRMTATGATVTRF